MKKKIVSGLLAMATVMSMSGYIIYYAIDVYWWCGAQFTGITWEYRL